MTEQKWICEKARECNINHDRVQRIGNLVCEGCGPDADCGIDPEECERIAEAIEVLNE